MTSIILKNVNVLTMADENVLENVDILIDNGQIKKIGTQLEFDNAQIIDCSQQYVMPGLYDMHAHLYTSEGDLALYLANGVTTIRNMWGEPLYNEFRDKINKGEMVGPTVYNFGQIMDGDPPVRQPDRHNVTIKTVEEAKREVYRMKDEGYDFIKIYDMLSLDNYNAIAEVAKECNMKFAGHVPRAVGFENVVKAGQHSIEHMAYVTESDINLAATSGIWICPTISVLNTSEKLYSENDLSYLLEDTRIDYIDKETRSMWEMSVNMKEWYEQMDGKMKEAMDDWRAKSKYHYIKPLISKAYQAGCNMILGTDTPNPFIYPGFSIHEELELMVDCGLTPYDAIKTGTYNAAKCLDELDVTGTLEVGKNADLVLLESNPLENISNTRKIVGVMKKGQWFDSKKIEEMLVGVKNLNS